MSSISKSASDATTSVFTTVGTVANQLTNAVNTTGQALDMLSSFVTTARTKQIARTAIDLETFYDELVEESAFEAAQRQAILIEKLSSNENLKKMYEENHNKFDSLIKNLRPTKTEE